MTMMSQEMINENQDLKSSGLIEVMVGNIFKESDGLNPSLE